MTLRVKSCNFSSFGITFRSWKLKTALLIHILIFLTFLCLRKHYDSKLLAAIKQGIKREFVEVNTNYDRLWFIESHTAIFPMTNRSNLPIFPKENPLSDRIINQLMYIPPNYNKNISENAFKTIRIADSFNEFYMTKPGTENFEKCPVSTCKIVNDPNADLIIYKHSRPTAKTKPGQIHMIVVTESPFHSGSMKGSFDWTSTYRRDSDICAPYDKWMYYDPRIKQKPQNRNYAQNKTKMVAWFVSNCFSKNHRLEFAHELQKYVPVDIYGQCGNFTCPRNNHEACIELLKNDYKFYLSFENSDCQDYITEKFFTTGLSSDVIPIVMGGRIEDYRRAAPERSFIHVDEFDSVKGLADYLKLLDSDDTLYNSYFKWKDTGRIIDHHYWCRVCALLYAPTPDSRLLSLHNTTFEEWWGGNAVCKKYDKHQNLLLREK